MADHNNPQSRAEEILIATIDGTEYDKLPQSRLEELLLELKEVIEEGGGGGEGGLIQKIFLNGVEQQITNKAVYLTVITNTVNDLVNYYLKTDTYSKLEVNNLIAAIQTVHLQKVETLPTEDISQTTIYIVPKSTLLTNNVYDEYINTDGTSTGWELIGDTQIDLSDYVTFTDLEALLDDYVLATDLTTTLADYALAADVTTALAGKVDKVTGKGLSTNDFTDEYKAAIGSNTTAITAIKDGQSIDSFADVETALNGKVDAVSGKGLSENDYTDADKAIVGGVTTALAGKVDTSSVGSASGVAELDTNGKVPSSQLPSYVDDVLEYASQSAFPAEGETGKIYIAKDTNKTYRWSGTAYVEISESLALGETSSTAYAGNKGKANADAISAIKDGTSIDSFADVETALANKQDAYETITYAQWQALTPAQQAAKDYYISDYPSSVLTAGNIAYDNTTSGMSANKVQGAIDELKSGLTNVSIKTDFYTSIETGVTVDASTWIMKCGNHIIGDIVIICDTDITAQLKLLFTLKYAPVANINSYCVGAKTEWRADVLLHYYCSENNSQLAVQNFSGASDIVVAKIHLDYFTS